MATVGKLPYIKLYIGDLKKEKAYTCLTMESRLVWLEMIFIMHDAVPRGYIDMTPEEISRAISVPKKIVTKCLAEMERVGTFSKNEQGIIFNRRMVRETELSGIRAEAGKAGAFAANLPRQKRGKNSDLPEQASENGSGKTGPFTDCDCDSELGVDCSLEKQVPNRETAIAVIPVDRTIERWQELKEIYWAAGKPWPESHEQRLFQRFISLEDHRQTRLLDYVKRRLLDGTWRDAQHTKSLSNLLSDGDFDAPEIIRSLPQVIPKSRTQTNHDKAAAEFIAEERRAGR